MKDKNIKKLRNLNYYCYICGTFMLFLGMGVLYISALELDAIYLEIGILIFITGYAFVNIARKIYAALNYELNIES